MASKQEGREKRITEALAAQRSIPLDGSRARGRWISFSFERSWDAASAVVSPERRTCHAGDLVPCM